MVVKYFSVVFFGLVVLAACNNKPVIEKKFTDALKPDPAAILEEATLEPEETPSDRTLHGKKLSIVNIRSIESIAEDGVHDLENDAVVVLQDPKVAMADFPLDRRKQVNWVQALENGHINPRADLQGEGDMLVMDMDIVMKNTKFMPYVRFPHYQHTKWLDCSNCHPKIFIPQEHANPISMNKVLRGEFCGVCHDKVAFALFICERCHSVPHKESGKWW